MASFVVIEFDRTKPTIEIYAPNYTTSEILNVITVEANEPLSTFQEFYAVDHQGNRYDYTFYQETPNTFIGRVRFNALPSGILRLYARVKDEVDNISDLAMVSIDVKEDFQLLKMEVSHQARDIKDAVRPHSNHSVKDYERNLKVNQRIAKTAEQQKTMRVEETHDDADLV